MKYSAFDGEKMRKARLLIPLTVQFSVRYLIRTGLLDYIKEYAIPIIVVGWQDDELTTELLERGVEVHTLPEKKISKRYLRLMKQIYQWHVRYIASPTTAIDQRRNYLMMPTADKIRTTVRDNMFRLALMIPGYEKYILAKQQSLVWEDTNIAEHLKMIEEIKPDVIFSLTPYFIEEELLLRAAQTESVSMIVAYLSFDNITTRNYVPLDFDEYFVWNKYNHRELLRIYPKSRLKSVTIVGAPQFDFYYDNSYLWDETRWRQELGLPANRPVILFGSTGRIIAPQEHQWLYHLDTAIENGEIFGNPVILLRRHPNDPIEYWQTAMNRTNNVVYSDPWSAGKMIPGKTNVARYDIEKLASTLFFSSIHVNASSTMTIDGAIYNRPQIGPAYDEEGEFDIAARELYLREHYLPITNSGGLDIAYSRRELINALNSAGKNPDLREAGRKRLVREICTYEDGKSAERVSQALYIFLNKRGYQ